MSGFQTLSDFVNNPFGNKNMDKRGNLEGKYQQMKSKSTFKVGGFTEIDGNYLIHILVPSDSNPQQSYDVVILFFADDTVNTKGLSFSNYYVKFFSNSPSFIYHYAYLYNKNGFLIDMLYDKLGINVGSEPSKTNPDQNLFYDKSIYCACRYLLDNNLTTLSKFGILTFGRKTNTKFFSDIKSFESVKMTMEIHQLDKKLNRELKSDEKKKSSDKKAMRSGSHTKQKIGAKTSTSKKISNKVVPKKSRKTTTRQS